VRIRIIMGIAERKAKEKENLKTLILQGAHKLFLEKGIERTTIRNIADEIEYSVGTVYVYFKDKNDILHHLHTQGFQQLGGEMRVLFNVSNPMERLKAIGRVYIQFALDNPEMYDLMFTMKAPIEVIEQKECDDWNEGKLTFDVLSNTVKECIEAGHFKGHDLQPLSYMIWSTTHGMCALYIAQRTRAVHLDDPESIVGRAYEEFIKVIDKL